MSFGFRQVEVRILSGWIEIGHGGMCFKTSLVEWNATYIFKRTDLICRMAFAWGSTYFIWV